MSSSPLKSIKLSFWSVSHTFNSDITFRESGRYIRFVGMLTILYPGDTLGKKLYMTGEDIPFLSAWFIINKSVFIVLD